MKRWIKGTGITLLTLIVLILMTFGIACWVIFTPAKLTSTVDRLAGKYLTCDMQVNEVSLTLFSSFPNISLSIHDLALINPVSDEVNDTVAAITRCEAVLDIKELIRNGGVTLRKLHLDGGRANLYTDTLGQANFMVFPTDTTTKDDDDTPFSLPALDLHEISVRHLQVSYRDEQAHQQATIGDLNLTLSGNIGKDGVSADLHTTIGQVSYTLQGDSPMQATLRDLSLKAGGDFTEVEGDAHGRLHIGHLLADVADMKADITDAAWDLQGTLDNRQWTLHTQLATQPAQLTMQGTSPMQVSTDALTLSADGSIFEDDIRLTPSLSLPKLTLYMNKECLLSDAHIQATLPLQTDTLLQHTLVSQGQLALNEYTITLNGELSRPDTLTTDARLHFETNTWDIAQLLTLIPSNYQHLIQDIQASGLAQLNGTLQGGSHGNTFQLQGADANLALSHLGLQYTDSLQASTTAANIALSYTGAGNKSKETAKAMLHADDLDMKMVGTGNARINGLEGTVTLPRPSRLGKGYIDATAHLDMQELWGTMDTLTLYTRGAGLNLGMKADGKDSHPLYHATLDCDTLQAAMGSFAAASTQAISVNAQATYDAHAKELLAQWSPSVRVNLNAGHLDLDPLTLPCDIPHIDFAFHDGRFTIHDSRILLGKSDFNLQGDIHNIDSFIDHTGLLKADLDFTSAYTDLNELMDLVSGLGADSTATAQQEAEQKAQPAEESDPFMVPLGIDARLRTDIRTAGVNGFHFDDINGTAIVKDGILVLEEMGFTSKAARMQLTAMYKSPRRNHLFLGFDFHLLDIQIDDLIDLIPDVDSIVPMLSAFDGEAQFHIAAETYLKSNYDIKLSTLRGAAAIEGKDLVVMDNETFSQIAKILRFEKKTRNVVDSLDVELTVFRDEVDLYPFLISMDDYKAVISGRHNINENLDFKYHISLTDCPLPIRLGLDVTGTLDDLHFKPARCKYAHLYNPKKQKVTQAQTLRLKKLINDSLKDNVKPQAKKRP